MDAKHIEKMFACYLLTNYLLTNYLLTKKCLKNVIINLQYEEGPITFIQWKTLNGIEIKKVNYQNVEEIREGRKTDAWIKAEGNLNKMLNKARIFQEKTLVYFSIVCKSSQRILPGETHDFVTADEKIVEELRELSHKLKENNNNNNKLLTDITKEDCLFDSNLNHDMDQPMSHYFIASSHNTYLTGRQIGSSSSYEIYRNILLDGCRCIEIDIWEGLKGKMEPVVTHACRTFTEALRVRFTGKILLGKVLEIIKEFAFAKSKYPLILSIENHLEKEQSQKRLTKMLNETFGKMLCTDKINLKETQFPDLSKMKNKIFIKDYKELRIPKSKVTTDQPVEIDVSPYVDCIGDSTLTRGDLDNDKLSDDDYDYDEWDSDGEDYPDGDKFNLSDDEYDYDEWDCKDADYDRQYLDEASSQFVDKRKGKSADAIESLELNYNYPQMINYFEANKFKDMETCIQKFKFYQMISRKETKSLEILDQSILNVMENESRPNKYRQFTRTNMVRVYPRGRRQDSSNYNPVRHWYGGAQMVALNYQTCSEEMLINWAQFALNGGCGYVLKPEYLRIKETKKPARIYLQIEIVRGEFGNMFPVNTKIELKVTTLVYCPDAGTHLKTNELKRDDYSKVPMETRIISDNGVNPVWNHLMDSSYHLSNPELSFVLFSLMNGTDCTVGQYMIAVQAMKTEGWIDLYDNKMNKIPSAKIYVKVSKITEKKEEGVCN